jgi:hypothetical protein
MESRRKLTVIAAGAPHSRPVQKYNALVFAARCGADNPNLMLMRPA